MSDNQENPQDNDQPDDQPNGHPASASTDAAAASAEDTPIIESATPTPTVRIAALEAEKVEIRDRMLRIAADFDNWKKRSRKDQADGEMRAKEAVLRDFLEIIDNLERASASWGEGKEGDAKSIRDGVELVLRQFRSKLERYQVKSVESAGLPFDPRMHEAISQVPTADVKPGSVLHELQKGYVIGEKLLRPAMVVVATALPTPKPPEDSAPVASQSDGED
jgi:molecular chaperone GrpE